MIEDLIRYNKEANPEKVTDTVIYRYLKELGKSFYCSNFDKVEADIASILTRIPAMFSNYTNHDITHSLRVADYMVSLLPASIDKYSCAELAIMLICAIFHDVGMCVSETESTLDVSKQDVIRKQHHIRSEEFVLKNACSEYFKIDNCSEVNFRKLVSLIVRAHGENVDWIEKNICADDEYGTDSVNPLFITCLLRLGDCLDFDSRRTPYSLFDYLQLRAVSYEEWKKHFPITNYKKINSERQIYFKGSCEEPEVYHQICKYFEGIEKEIRYEKILLFECDDKYKLDISDIVQNNIKHSNFSSVNLQFNMDYATITNLLMGENLYSDKTVVIRELLQNSIDACFVKGELCKKKSKAYNPEIKILIDSDKISICDNGIGMTKKVIGCYFLSIGKSYYSSESYKKLGCNYNPISHYGIGFLSTFLLADSVDVKTIPFEDEKLTYHFVINKGEKNVEIQTVDGCEKESGTSISFVNNKLDEVFAGHELIIQYIEGLFFNVPVPIKVYNKDLLIKTISIRSVDMTKRIDISKYLNNVQCSFKTISRKQSCLIRELDYPFSIHNAYVYAPKHLPDAILDERELFNYQQNTGACCSVSNFILPSNKMQILKIYPLDLEAESFYNNFFDYNDDSQNAFYKTFDAFPQDYIGILMEDSELLNEFEEYDKVEFTRDFGSAKYRKFIKKIKELLVRLKYEADSFMCYIDMESVFFNDNFYSFIVCDKEFKSKERNALAFHNIRVGQYRVFIPKLLDSFTPFQWYVNVNTEGVFPSVSRDVISSKLSAGLGYALGYAYNMYLLEHEPSPPKKEFIQQFIKKYYSVDSIFINRNV